MGFFRSKKLRTYLRTDHPQIYGKFYDRAYGTDIIVNPFGLIKFGFSKEKYGDAELDLLVDENRSFTILILTVFLTLPIIFLLIMI